MAALTQFKNYLKIVEKGSMTGVDVKKLTDVFESDPRKFGDHLQYSLHKYCKLNEHSPLETDIVTLSQLCFSKNSVLGFSNMDRFLGSLFHICMYFFKKEKHSVAIEMSECIRFRESDIVKASQMNQNCRNFLYVLHNSFLTAALEVNASSNLSYDLVAASMKFLKLIKGEQIEIGRKILRNFRQYFSTIKVLDSKNVHQIYREIQNALKIFLPFYMDNDFLFYYLMKMDHNDALNDMEMKELKIYFKNNIKMIGMLLGDDKTHLLYDCIVDFLFEDNLNECSEVVRNAVKKLISLKHSKIHCLILSSLFNHASRMWLKISLEDWGSSISSKFVEFVFNDILLMVRKCVGDLSTLCRTTQYQIEICFTDLQIINFQRILHVIRFCVKQNIPGCIDLMKLSRESFRVIKKHLPEMKNQCCAQRKKQTWTAFVIHYTNIIESLVRHFNSNAGLSHMRDCSEELICELITGSYELPYDKRRVLVLFQRWHYGNVKLKNYEEALFVCAFFYLSFPEELEEAVSMWVQTKILVSNSEIASVTFKDVIEKEKSRIQRMNPGCRSLTDENNLKKLLIRELIGYSSCSAFNFEQSNVIKNLVITLWETLMKMDLKFWEKAAVLNQMIATSISLSDSESLSRYKKECSSMLRDVSRTPKMKDQCRRLIYTGNLKYSLFLCQLKDVQESEDRLNSSACVLEYLRKEEDEKAKFGDVIDMNLTCNIMPSSNHITVAYEESYSKALGETFKLWQEAAVLMTEPTLEPYEFDIWLYFIYQISQFYCLLGDTHKATLSWILYYKIAKMCKNRSSILIGLSHILRECPHSENTSLLEEAEKIAREMTRNAKDKNALLVYWSAAASNYLRNKNTVKCFDYLTKLKEHLDGVRERAKSLIFQARYWCLVSKLVCLQKEYLEKSGLNSSTDPRSIVLKAFRYLNALVKSDSIYELGPCEYTEVLLAMMEVNVWAAQVHAVYYQASFVKFFLNDLYQIFQKLVLPARTADILVRLTEVDVMCENWEDGNLKLSSLKAILGKAPWQETEFQKPEQLRVPSPGNVSENGSPRALSPARFLDTHHRREADPSPVQCYLKEDTISKFFDHPSDCECYPCRNLLIRLLNLNTLHLEAQLNRMKGYMKKSCICYRESYRYLRRLETRRTKLNDHLKKVAASSVKGFDFGFNFERDSLAVNCVKFLTSYSLFLLSPSSEENLSEEVIKLIRKIDEWMDVLSHDSKLLQWSVMEMKLALVTTHSKKQKTVLLSPEIVTERVVPVKTPLPSRRPAGNLAPVKYALENKNKSPNYFLPKIGSRIVFAEEDEEDSDSPVVVQRKLRNRRKLMENVELLS